MTAERLKSYGYSDTEIQLILMIISEGRKA